MRVVGFLIKSLLSLAILLAAAAAALFWLPTGRWLILPAVQYFGDWITPSIHVADIQGSLHQGYSLSSLALVSGDETYLTLDRAAVSPDWDAILSGTPWLRSLSLKGLSADVAGLQTVADRFSSDEGQGDSSFSLTIRPLEIDVRDVRLASPQGTVSLASLLLSEDGRLSLEAAVGHPGGRLPLALEGRMGFEPLALLSGDLQVGKGQGSLKGRLEPPFDLYAGLSALPLETVLAFVPGQPVKGSGRVDGRVFVKGGGGKENPLTASGVLAVPRSAVMDVPLALRIPWSWDGRLFFVEGATLRTKAAALDLNLRMDTETLRLTAQGNADHLSLREIGRIAAPDVGLAGEGGRVKFNLETDLNRALETLKGELTARIPEVTMGIPQGRGAVRTRLVKDLAVDVKLSPNREPRLSCTGEVFGGKLFGRGEAALDGSHPQAVLSLVNLNLGTLAAAFPALAEQKPSGRVSATARVAQDLSAKASLTSDKLTAAGVTLQKLAADVTYNPKRSLAMGNVTLDKITAEGVTLQGLAAGFDYRDDQVALTSLTGKLGKAALSASGRADLKAQALNFKAAVRNLDPRAIPQLKDASVKGLCDLDATVAGTFSSPQVGLRLRGRNVSAAEVPLGTLNLAVDYAKDQLSIPETRLNLPGGALTVRGNVALGGKEPRLDLAASTTVLNLSTLSRALKLQPLVTGTAQGRVSVKGPLSTATVAASLKAANVRVQGIAVPTAELEASGSMARVDVKKLEAQIVPPGTVKAAWVQGQGKVVAGKKSLMDSALDVGVNVRGLELRPVAGQFMDNPPVGGTLNGSLNLRGTPAKPILALRVNSPISVSQIMIDSMALDLSSPAKDRYALSASGKMGDFRLALDGDLRRRGDAWDYSVTTRPVDIAQLLTVVAPDAAGMAAGAATVRATGTAPGTAPIHIQAAIPKLTAAEKVEVRDIALPLDYWVDSSKITMRKGRAVLAKGVILTDADVDLNLSSWKANVRARGIDFTSLTAPFLPEGELVGSADVNVDAKGNFGGLFATSSATGNFTTSSGYLHKMAILEKVSHTKRLSFENIRGTFFWDGSDLFLNPGSQATAGPEEPLYRYFAINGSMGIPGKGLKLLCNGRFDLKVLDRFLGAMKGVFQYMTGSVSGNLGFLKDAAGRMIGLRSRDFENVSFTLSNSWQDLQLLDLKIDKPIQDFLPIDKLNEVEEQREGKQYQLRLKFPAGPGGANPEDESTSDQFKRQLLDNLFSM